MSAQPRFIRTLPKPGVIPSSLTPDQARQMAEQVAMCCAEAGHPTTVEQVPDSTHNWMFPGAPVDVVDRARLLVFERWGLA